MTKLRVLVVSPTFLPVVGGAEVGIHEICNRLGLGHEVCVLSHQRQAPALEVRPMPSNVGKARYERAAYVNSPVQSPAIIRRFLNFLGIGLFVAVRKQLRSFKPDVVNLHFIVPPGLPVLMALRSVRRDCRPKFILSLVARGDVIAEMPWYLRLYARVIFAAADVVVVNSDIYLQGSNMIDSGKVVKIPYGVDTRGYEEVRSSRWSLERDDPRLIAVQRLVAVKRVSLLVRALSLVIEVLPSATLTIVGYGPESESLKLLAHELGIGERVIFKGYLPDDQLVEAYRAADLFVSASEYETFGVTFVEAMAAGLPVVAMDNSCVSEVVTSDVGALVTIPSPDKYADAVLGLLSDPGRLQRMSSAGTQRASTHYDWQVVSNTYENLLVRVCEVN